MTMNVLLSPLRRRVSLAAMVGAAALLSGCGAGSVFSELVPTRMVVMGDGLADMGFGGTRYTVNDGSINTWVQQLASSYGLSLAAQSASGQNWARGNARVALKPDAAGNAATLTITEQIDAFLAANSIGKDDIVVLDAGISDLVVQANAVTAGSITSAQALVNAAEAGKALGRASAPPGHGRRHPCGGGRSLQPGQVTVCHGARHQRATGKRQFEIQRGPAGGHGGFGCQCTVHRCSLPIQPADQPAGGQWVYQFVGRGLLGRGSGTAVTTATACTTATIGQRRCL